LLCPRIERPYDRRASNKRNEIAPSHLYP
jgi:hypothetical protein